MTALLPHTIAYHGATPFTAANKTGEQVWPVTPTVGYADHVKALAPVSYWRLGESVPGAGAADEMGLYGCAWTGNPTLGVPGLLAGDADTAMQVHGVISQGASAGNPADYWLQTLTLEAWIKTSGAGAAYRGIVVKQDGYALFAVDNVLAVYEWATGQAISSGVNIADGQPHHVVVAFQPSGSQMYVDGTAAGPTFNHQTQSHSYPLTIGYATFSGQEFTGTIDEVAIYARALTAQNIADTYQIGSTP